MRLKTEFWVAAFLRRCSTEGLFGAVIHHGADEAGVVFIYVNHLDGTYDLLVPPPGPAYDEQGERRFIKAFKAPRDWQAASTYVQRRREDDPDLWAIEIEDRHGLASIAIEGDNIS
ncbi:MAG: DUF1491 family protein [Alphaproteobacteria bacterium]|nr:DUF1491 family protein [Alphaproteobacteria bacterium]